VETVEYGNQDGRLVVYFHGVPGALAECSIFEQYVQQHQLRIICFDRFALDAALEPENYYQQLANAISAKAGEAPVDIIGFSIGAHVALEMAARLKQQLGQLHLVSAAAPLDAGDFIEHMAGGLVFKLAKNKPRIFSLLTYYQKLMALVAPQMLTGMLFASAAGKGKQLSQQAEFKNFIGPILAQCFRQRVAGYIRDVRLYVNWSGKLTCSASNTYLWHGTKDNWSPFAMAEYLTAAIPAATTIEPMEGLSHYSCLTAAAPKICALLARS